MEKTYKVIPALTEKGNLKNVVRDNLKKQATKKFFQDWTLENDGSFTYDLVEDTSGRMIKARVQLSISALDTYSTKSSKKVEEEEIKIPSLF